MIIGQLDIHGLGAVEPEHDAPVGAHANAPLARPVAAQRVQPVPRQVEIAGSLADIGRRANLTDDEFAQFERARETRPAEPVNLE